MPATISLECDRLKQENIVYLYKNGIKVVTAKLQNSTFEVDNNAFSAVSTDSFSITFNLLKTSLGDEGKYICMTMENGTNISGNQYSLRMFCKYFEVMHGLSKSLFLSSVFKNLSVFDTIFHMKNMFL